MIRQIFDGEVINVSRNPIGTVHNAHISSDPVK